MPKKALPFDINAPVNPSKFDHRTAFRLRVENGASLEEMSLLIRGGANPFAGSPSAMDWLVLNFSPDWPQRLTVFLDSPFASEGLTEQQAIRAYKTALKYLPRDSSRDWLLDRIQACAPGVQWDHRDLVLQSLSDQLSPGRRVSSARRPASGVDKLPLFQEVKGWPTLSADEFLLLNKGSVSSWPVLKTFLEKVPVEDRLKVWKQGLVFVDSPGDIDGWVPRFFRYASATAAQKMLKFCCLEWCLDATSDQTEAARLELVRYLLSSLEISPSSNPIRTFPQTAELLFPGQQIATAFERAEDQLWSWILSGYAISRIKNHNQNHTDDRLNLAAWLLSQPHPPLDKTHLADFCVFMSWESLAKVVDRHSSIGSPDGRAQKTAQLGYRLLELGASKNWSHREYYREDPFNTPVLRGVQETAYALERSSTLNETLPSAASGSSRGPRF